MTKCKCGKRLRWDWEQDAYIVGEDKDVVQAKEDDDGTGLISYSCTCGEPIGKLNYADGGFEDVDWLKDVDWEDEENAGSIGLISQQKEEV